MLRLVKRVLGSLALALAAHTSVQAQVYDIDGIAAFDIMPGHRSENGHHFAAARIRMAKGWKTYWRQPGGNGIPPQITWTRSQNLRAARIHWPKPRVFGTGDARVIGYQTELILPIELVPETQGQDIVLRGRIDFGVCEDVCVPVSAPVEAVLSGAAASPDPQITAALSQTTSPSRRASVLCDLRPVEDGFQFTGRVRGVQVADKDAFMVVEYPGRDVWIDLEPIRKTRDGLRLNAVMYDLADGPFLVDRSRFVFTLFDQGRLLEVRGCQGSS